MVFVSKPSSCGDCSFGKKKHVTFDVGRPRATEFLEYVYSYVRGPTPVASFGGASYFVLFVDNFSRKVWVYFLKAKDEIFAQFCKWKTLVEKQSRKRLKVLKVGNSSEFMSQEFTNCCGFECVFRDFLYFC